MNKNKLAIITGASRGIGLSSALKLANKGFDIAICGRKINELRKASKIISSYKVNCYYKVCDVSNEVSVKKFIKTIIGKNIKIDILVNNAGIQFIKSFEKLKTSEWKNVIDINLNGYFYFIKHVGKYMIKQKYGKIINISSVLSKFAIPGRAPYSVSKAGIESLTRSVASEWAKYNISVNSISPGHISTDLIEKQIKNGTLKKSILKKRSVVNKIGNVEDVSKIVEFLSISNSNFITGENIVVDGGFSINKV